MRRGPKSKPTVLHRVRGTYRPHRHENRLEPQAPGELTLEEPPAHFTAPQRERWHQVLKDAPRGILCRIDGAALAAFVTAADLLEQASRAQAKLAETATAPLLVRGDKGVLTLSPFVKLQLKAIPLLLRAAAECGFTPTARAGMKIDDGAGRISTTESARWALFDSLGPKKSNQADLLAAKPASAQPQ
jgi:phage terminase small subunit